MTDITVNEIREAACGTEADGSPKAIVITGLQKFNKNDTTEDPISLMEVSTVAAVVDIKTIGNFSYVNLKFPGSTNGDLSLFYRCLERYFEVDDESDENNEVVAFISIIPFSLSGEFLINAVYPIFWALEPDVLNDPPRTLRVVFAPEDIQYIYSDLNTDEVAEMIAAAQAEAEAENEYVDEDKVLENEEFEDAIEERNRSFTDDKYAPENRFSALSFEDENESEV